MDTRHATTTKIVLTTWEQAYGLGPVERGLALLTLAQPQKSLTDLGQLTIGQRDGALLDLRGKLFGGGIQCLDECPGCAEKIEVSFGLDDIRVQPMGSTKEVNEASAVIEMNIEGQSLAVRPPTTSDLLAIECESNSQSRRAALLSRCVTPREADSQNFSASPPCGTATFSKAGLKEINDKLAEIDPQADVRIALDCPRCQRQWSSRFDIAQFLWSEIDAWAKRLLAEVHALALAYGWPEQDILALSPWRRQLYLGMLRR